MIIRTDSTEFIFASVTADHDLAGRSIDVALPASGEAPATWYPATVVSVAQTTADRWTATYKLLVGPSGGATTLTPGTYDWTMRLTDSPERPVRKTGSVQVTLT